MLHVQTSLREEWPDTDFDIPDGQAIVIGHSDLERDHEDWDFDIQDEAVSTIKARQTPGTFAEDNFDDEVPTIKPKKSPKNIPLSCGEDNVEDAFALPDGLSRLSLRPLSHRLSQTGRPNTLCRPHTRHIFPAYQASQRT